MKFINNFNPEVNCQVEMCFWNDKSITSHLEQLGRVELDRAVHSGEVGGHLDRAVNSGEVGRHLDMAVQWTIRQSNSQW